jgi:4-hydroxybenzoate polyprenyltransferase
LNTASVRTHSELERGKLFLALSRTPHALLDMATPALAAVLSFGGIPAPSVAILGLITAFAGYTAVYALNDLVDYRVDKEKLNSCGLPCTVGDLDAVYVRHPLARGLISLRHAVLWTAGWALVALIGAYLLNPVCVLVFLFGCVAETAYCLLFRVSWLRTLISGTVKTAGGIAAVFAVTPEPEPLFLVNLFAWLFAWEVGGQNVPNDLSDVEQDQVMKAETVPIHFGREGAIRIISQALVTTTILSLVLYYSTPAHLSPLYLPGALASAVFLLLIPAYRLQRAPSVQLASALFNRSSYYPLFMLMIILMSGLLA